MNWTLIIAAAILVAPPTLVAVLSLRAQLRATREVSEYHVMVNSRMDQLLALTASSSHAEGVADERANPGTP